MIVRKSFNYSLDIYCWFLQIVIVLTLLLIVLWRSLLPKCPDYTIANVYVPALEGRNSTFDHQIEAIRNTSMFFNLKIFNPNNRFSICYDDINVTLCYNNVVIGAKSIPAFYQGYKKTAVCELVMIDDGQAWGGVGVGNWTTELGVHLETMVRYKIFELQMMHHRVDLEANVPIGSDGRIVGEKNIKLHSKHKLKKKED